MLEEVGLLVEKPGSKISPHKSTKNKKSFFEKA
jgi:hypothetical protein